MCACVLQCRKHFTLTKFDHVNKDKLTWPDWPCWLCHNVLHTYELASIISITWDITNGRSYSDITNYELQLSGGGSSRNSCNVFQQIRHFLCETLNGYMFAPFAIRIELFHILTLPWKRRWLNFVFHKFQIIWQLHEIRILKCNNMSKNCPSRVYYKCWPTFKIARSSSLWI